MTFFVVVVVVRNYKSLPFTLRLHIHFEVGAIFPRLGVSI